MAKELIKRSEAERHTLLETLAGAITHATGSTLGFLFATTLVVAWTASNFWFCRPIQWGDIVVMVTLLMTFLIQRHHNKNMAVIHLKLDEIISSHDEADNALIKAEEASEQAILLAKNEYKQLAEACLQEKLDERDKVKGSM